MGVWVVGGLLVLHGLIHVFGVLRMLGIPQLAELGPPMSRLWGASWGIVALAFVVAGVARVAGAAWWWMLAAPALVGSQALIFAFFGDAKFGTLVNLVLVVPVAVAFGQARFAARTQDAVERLAADARPAAPERVTDADVGALPGSVARWVRAAGVVGRPRATAVRLEQRGELQTAPDGDWMPFRARQWIAATEPGFVWTADVDGPLGTHLSGLDRLADARGSMRIELLSLVPIVDASGPRIDQGALVRYLAELQWYPSAVFLPGLRWESAGPHSARAFLRSGELEVSGTFRFDEHGDVVGFEAKRYREDTLEDWVIENDPASVRELDGIRVPTRSTITWREAGGREWTWLRLEVVGLEREG